MPTLSEMPQSVRDFLDRPATASVATINRDGSPQVTYIIFMRVGDEIQFSTQETSQKVKNLRRDPRLTFAVMDPTNPQRTVIVSGTATVGQLRGDDVWEYMELNARRRMTVEEAKAYVEGSKSQPRVLIRITPTRIRTAGLT